MRRLLASLVAIGAAYLLLAAAAPPPLAPQAALGQAGDSTAPPNDPFPGYRVFGSNPWIRGPNTAATGQAGEPNHAGASQSGTGGGSGELSSVWWNWLAPESGPVTISLCDSTYDTTLAVYSGADLSSLTMVVANDDTAGCGSSGKGSSVSFPATKGTRYWIAVDGHEDAAGRIEGALTLTVPPPGNDDFPGAPLSGIDQGFSGDNVNASGEPGEPDHAGLSLCEDGAESTSFDPHCLRSAWWSWIAPADGTASVGVCDSDFDTTLAVYTGAAVDSLTQVAANQDTPDCGLFGNRGSRVTFTAAGGTTYRIAVDGYYEHEGDIGGRLALAPNEAPTGPAPGDQGAPAPPPPSGSLDVVAATIRQYAVRPYAFRARSRGQSVLPAAAPLATRVGYRLSEPARARFAVERAAPGRRVGRRCARLTPRNRGRRPCTRYLRLRGSFRHQGAAGKNAFTFTGRIGGRKLRAGRFRLVMRATDAAGNRSTPKRTGFRIVAR
jgi:hypothetical protein